MIDKLGRKINYLRISLTDRCNLRCLYCMPPEGVQLMSHEDMLRNEEMLLAVQAAAQLGIEHIRLTGGEPLLRRGIVELIRQMKQVPGIKNISLTSNGILLPRMASDLREAGLDRINLSLDSLDPDKYRLVTRCGNLSDALAGLDAALEAGFEPLKINAVAIRRLEQDFYRFALLSMDKPLHLRFIEYMPVGSSSGMAGDGWGPKDYIPCEEIIDRINQAAAAEGRGGLIPLKEEEGPLGYGPARYYRFPGALGSVGFISPLSKHFCGSCNRLRLTADGMLRPCLFSDVEFDLKSALRAGDMDSIVELFKTAIGDKPDEHHGKQGSERKMAQIGG